MTHRLPILFVLALSLRATMAGTRATDVTGTWTSSADRGSGPTPDGTLVLKQQGEQLTGTLSGATAERRLTGTVKGDKVVFSFDQEFGAETHKITYSGTIESATKISETIEHPKGPVKWTATKKER